MAEFVYVACTLTSAACAALLVRSYFRTRSRLLMWSSLCFVGLAVNSVLLFVDLVVVPSYDLRVVRSGSAVCALALLVVGLIGEQR